MKSIHRTKSVLTDRANLEPLFSIQNFPIFIGCTDELKEADWFEDLSFDICRETGVIQLAKLIPLDVLYKNYHSEALGGIWARHHLEFLSFIRKNKTKNILEIGGSNGTLATTFLKKTKRKNVSWTIVEPGPSISSTDSRLRVISDFFPTTQVAKDFYDTVVHSHVMEHMYDPATFLNNIAKNIHPEGYHIFSIPNLKRYVLNNQANALNFEHTIFLTEEIIDYLLARTGFKIIEKQFYLDHSIFYATRYTGQKSKISFPNHYTEYKKLFTDYYTSLKSLAHHFNETVKIDNNPIYIFGAHVFTQFLIALGLEESKITAVLDNSKYKQGKRLYGTGLFVRSLESIKNDLNPSVILNAGQYQEELRQQLIGINPSVKIIEKV